MAETELKEKKKSIEVLEHDLMRLLIPKDENDKKLNFEIRVETGGDEALYSQQIYFQCINDFQI